MSNVIELSPKGSAWLVFHRRWAGGGCSTVWAFVFDYHAGLTAYEAWELAKLPGLPPFCEVLLEQLAEFPSANVNTKPALRRLRRIVADKQLFDQLCAPTIHIQPAELEVQQEEPA